MKKYCFDTSGISTPLERLPEDIYESLWFRVIEVIESGIIAVTTEIYDEMHGSFRGRIGQCIDGNRARMVLEVGDDSWDEAAYRSAVTAMQENQHDFISEYTGGSRRTVGLNDISIIALAKALTLPVVSMEASATTSTTKRKIPDVCRAEGVEHLDFNAFLRREEIRF